MSDQKFLPHSSAKLQQWEITKGHLRAMVALEGALSNDGSGVERPKFINMRMEIERFIVEFESQGFHWGFD